MKIPVPNIEAMLNHIPSTHADLKTSQLPNDSFKENFLVYTLSKYIEVLITENSDVSQFSLKCDIPLFNLGVFCSLQDAFYFSGFFHKIFQGVIKVIKFTNKKNFKKYFTARRQFTFNH